MKYLIDISQRQANKIQKYLDQGQYVSISQFIITAIENQFSLEDGEFENESTEDKSQAKSSHSIQNPLRLTTALEAYRIDDMPNFYDVIKPPDFKQTVLSTQELPEKNVWLWGQINKIFPIKIGLRILQKNLEQKRLIELNDFLKTAATEAAEIGNIIREYETKSGKERNEKISAGLPRISDEKSQSRYKFQFLAYQRKDDLLDGAMAILRFCNLEKRGGKTFIGLTEWGVKFSNALNPVLDKGDLDNSLSPEEVQCYLDHVDKNVISESIALKWLLDKINKGLNERDKINNQLAKDYSGVWTNATNAVFNTQRAGLTARAFELGLIDKQKYGIWVSYSITDSGLKYLKS